MNKNSTKCYPVYSTANRKIDDMRYYSYYIIISVDYILINMK